MAVARTRTLGLVLAVGSAVMALRPIGPLAPLGDLLSLPARLAAPLAAPTLWVGSARSASAAGSDEEVYAAESDLSARLELAVLQSAWPVGLTLGAGVDPIAGEVEARRGRSRDIIRVRVLEPERIAVGQPVVAGDVYVGRVWRVPFRESVQDRPGVFERVLRVLRLSSPPVPPPRDAVDVALITGADERVGGYVPLDQSGRSCDLVVGGLAPRDDRVWLAVHTPGSRATRSGRVIVKEPSGLLERRASLAEGFLVGDLMAEEIQDEGVPFTRTVLGIRPLIDFASGLNQVIVLAPVGATNGSPRTGPLPSDVVPVMEDGGWAASRALAIGDTSPWRAVFRINRGQRDGVREGAAVVDGVRFAGRVARADHLTSSVAQLGDPGFLVSALAQSAQDPDAPPFAMGNLVSLGRATDGAILLRWTPEPGLRFPDWLTGEGVEATLWTGSGMERVPRGLRLGRTLLAPSDGSRILELREVANPRGQLVVRTGSARLTKARGGGEQ